MLDKCIFMIKIELKIIEINTQYCLFYNQTNKSDHQYLNMSAKLDLFCK